MSDRAKILRRVERLEAELAELRAKVESTPPECIDIGSVCPIVGCRKPLAVVEWNWTDTAHWIDAAAIRASARYACVAGHSIHAELGE